jgi:hypothetical protein
VILENIIKNSSYKNLLFHTIFYNGNLIWDLN